MVQTNNINNKILIICGATATGKSDLAIECAKRLNSEVISADSMYVYKLLNVGTAKPTQNEMQGIVHHLIDVVNPTDSFSVSDYKYLAEPKIEKLLSQGKIPVICGGTGFYINAILYNLSYGKGGVNLEIREKFKKIAEEQGNLAVYQHLTAVDSETAKRLHPNDLKRVIRALEIFYNCSKKSEIVDEFIPKYNYTAYAIDYPREELYERINKRVDIMIENGLVDEIKNLLSMGVTKAHQCMQAIGYKEMLDYLDGKQTLEDAVELIKLNTRHYAKRQITFFKRLPNLHYLTKDKTEKLAEIIIKGLKDD